MLPKLASGTSSIRTEAESLINGSTLKKMSTAMNMEAIGSNPVHPNQSINSVEIMTPTDPSVSAIM